VVGPELLGREAVPGEAAGEEVGDDDVGAGHELADERAALGVRQVDGERALAPVVELEGDVGVLHPVGRAGLAQLAPHAVTAERLDLDDVGAEVGQERAAARCRHPVGDLDHRDVVERARHHAATSEAHRSSSGSTSSAEADGSPMMTSPTPAAS
jgi:hypothetical protein